MKQKTIYMLLNIIDLSYNNTTFFIESNYYKQVIILL